MFKARETHLELSTSLDGPLPQQHLVEHHVSLRLLSHVLVGKQGAPAATKTTPQRWAVKTKQKKTASWRKTAEAQNMPGLIFFLTYLSVSRNAKV